MELDLGLEAAVNGGSGVLDVLLGVFVLTVKPVRPVQRLFGLFGICFGLTWVVTNFVVPSDDLGWGLWVGAVPVRALAGVALLALALRLPTPLPPAQRRFAVAAAGIVVFRLSATAFTFLVGPPVSPFNTGIPPAVQGAQTLADFQGVANGILFAGYLGALGLLALRFPGAAHDDRRSIALASAALVLYPASANAGTFLFRAQTHTPIPLGTWIGLAAFAVVVLLWLRNTAVGGSDGRLARNVALLTLAPMIVAGLLFDSTSRLGGPQNGLFRSLGVALLAYGILRHRLLDIDVKVKWTIKNSTVAAVFIGVFFVVSNSVQTFFQSTSLGPYLGIVAAGLLVFALAPLQHFAERVATAAMPGVKSTEQLSHPERAALYRDLARQAWADGVLTRDERDLLETARQRLGLSRDEAAALEGEVSRPVLPPA